MRSPSPRVGAAYLAALGVVMVAAVVGLLGLRGNSGDGAQARGVSQSPQSSTGSSAATPQSPRRLGQQSRIDDQRGDTTGPDLLSISAAVSHGVVQVQLMLAAPVTDDVVIRLLIDTDSDRTTGSVSFPCPPATLGADFEVVTQGTHVARFMTSVGDGCAKPFTVTASIRPTMRIVSDRVYLGIPLKPLRHPGEHLIGLGAEALRATGGQIDSCPGHHDPPLSVHY